MSRELHCRQQKNAFTVLVSTAYFPFSVAPRTSSQRELNQAAKDDIDHEQQETEISKEIMNV